jgi:hypothetical protein
LSDEKPVVLNIDLVGISHGGSVYIGRSTKYGNPYKIGKDGDRDEVCELFERNVLPTLDVSELRGKNLICHCAPKRCHGDSILVKANK